MSVLLLRSRTLFLRSSLSLVGESHARQELTTAGAVACRLYVIPTRKLGVVGKFSTDTASRLFNTSVPMSAIVDKISNLVVGDKTAKMDPKDEVFVGSIDQGTTSSRFLIFDKAGEPVAVHQEEFKQIYPNPG